MSGQTPYVLQELIGIKNEIGNVKIWFGRLQASRLTKTRFLAIIAIKKKREKVSVGCKERPESAKKSDPGKTPKVRNICTGCLP